MIEAIKDIDTLDDWKIDFLPRLQKSYIYSSLVEDCNASDKEVSVLIEKAVSFSIQRTKTIIRHMDEYTLHDDIHLFRVLYLMERLLTKEVIQNLSIPERMLLILSAFFHDIGMAPDEKEIITWKKVWNVSPEIENEEEQKLFDRFKRFYDARPEQQEIIEKLVKDGNDSKASIIKSYLLTDFIRQTHAERAREIIAKHWNGQIKYRDTDLTLELANICHSHNEDALKLMSFEKDYPCGNSYACLPLIGVILRLADILDFDAKRTPLVLYSHLYVRNPVSIKEWQKHRAIENWVINPNVIQFSAKCEHPAIEASIHEFCDLIDHELSICNNIITTLNEFNQSKSRTIQVKIPFQVTRDKIKTEKDILNNKPIYTYRDTKFNLSKRQVIDLLMGTKLYGNPEVALRELLQNSIDACQLRNAQEVKWGYSKYEPEITVKYYSENGEDILEVIDNGTGMDQDIIDNYYSRVGSSFYKSTEFYTLRSETNADFTPRSRFGIGVLSCFMVADILIVDTKRKKGPEIFGEAINISVEGQESIFWIKSGQREVSGTTTKLILRKGVNPWDRMSEDEFISSVERVIPNPPFKINIETTKTKKIRDENSFNEVTAESLKDYSWREKENIRTFEISLNKKELGFMGSAIVAILESHGKPIEKIELNSREIEIEGNTYTLERNLAISENSIKENSKSITIDDDGEINENSSSSEYARSKSRISLHGIEIPTTLFPESWRMKPNQVKITWPFPLVLVIDICGKRDLDLNSPRTEILMSDKWINFEEEIAFQICNSIAENVSAEYWVEWKRIISEGNKNEPFLRGLNKVEKI